ncbi:MAG: hypothetical protein ACRDIU_09480, partial [Actinomycetota bacterium]
MSRTPGGGITIVDDDGFASQPAGPLDGLGVPSASFPNSQPGRVFVTGLQSDGEADPRGLGYPPGAQNIVRDVVSYVTRGKLGPRLLLVINPVKVVGEKSRSGMQASGFVQCPAPGVSTPVPTVACWDAAGAPWQRHDPVGEQLDDPIQLDLNSVDFEKYDAIIVSGTWGAGAGQDEWDILMRRSKELVNFVNGGGGLAAFGETNWTSGGAGQPFQLTSPGPIFGFLPNLAVEPWGENPWNLGPRVKPAGAAMGIRESDFAKWPLVTPNVNYFPQTAGWQTFVVDYAGKAIAIGREGLEGTAPDSPGVSVLPA